MTAITDRKEQTLRLAPDRYRITRSFICNGGQLMRSIECANPAYGYRQLDHWEASVEAKAAKRSTKAA